MSLLKEQIERVPSSFKAVPWNYQRSILSSHLHLAMGFHLQVHHLSRWWVGRALEPQIPLAELCPFGHSLLAHTAQAPSCILREGVVSQSKPSSDRIRCAQRSGSWVQIAAMWAWSIPHRPVCLNIGSPTGGADLEDWRRLRSQNLVGASDSLGSRPFCLLSAL